MVAENDHTVIGECPKSASFSDLDKRGMLPPDLNVPRKIKQGKKMLIDDKVNNFDNIQIDLSQLFRAFPFDAKDNSNPGWNPFLYDIPHKLYRSRLIPYRYRKKLFLMLRRSRQDICWFNAFNEYWTKLLKGRKMWSVEDFFFLYGIYRMRSARQTNVSAISDTGSDDHEVHLRKWQNNAVISKLFHLVNAEFFSHDLRVVELMWKFHARPLDILEFGCGTAPVTLTVFEFTEPDANQRFFISDLEYLAFHYGCYRFRHWANIIPVPLSPKNGWCVHLT